MNKKCISEGTLFDSRVHPDFDSEQKSGACLSADREGGEARLVRQLSQKGQCVWPLFAVDGKTIESRFEGFFGSSPRHQRFDPLSVRLVRSFPKWPLFGATGLSATFEIVQALITFGCGWTGQQEKHKKKPTWIKELHKCNESEETLVHRWT